jgi:hypothetical protein
MTIHVALPVMVGAAIYVSWRSPTLLLFRWFRVAEVWPLIQEWRQTVAAMSDSLPEWFIYSIPDALWVYALAAAMNLIWEGHARRAATPWLICAVVAGCGGEVLQRFGGIPGTYDARDLLLSGCAWLLALVIVPAGQIPYGGNT